MADAGIDLRLCSRAPILMRDRNSMMTMTSALQDEERGAQVRAPRAEATTRGVVVTYPSGNAASHTGHMAATRNEIARHLATLTGFAYAGEYDALRHRDKPTYFVPSETMTTEMAAHAGVSGESDLFGGVVPHPFVATKTITHPLVDVAVASTDRLVRGVSPARRRRRARRLQRVRQGGCAGGRKEAARSTAGYA